MAYDDGPITQRKLRASARPMTVNERIDQLNESVELLAGMLQRCITASEAARQSSDNAVVASRETAHQIGTLARDFALGRNEVRIIKGKIETIEKTIGRWPTSPDDTGSGLAGRVAMTSAHRIEVSHPSDMPPKALTAVWKKHKRLGLILAAVGAVVYTILQTLALTSGGGSP